jgi:peroxiredoxin
MTKIIQAMNQGSRLRAGDVAPWIRAIGGQGTDVSIPEMTAPLTHLQFLRFAGCPVCNLHLQGFIRRHGELRAAGVREVALFHSEASFIHDYYGPLPFELIADPRREIYRRYQVEASPWAIMSPRAWPALFRGYRLKRAGVFDSTTLGLPADFLIDASGLVIDCKYGSHASDMWSVDELLALARGSQPARPDSPMRHLAVTP